MARLALLWAPAPAPLWALGPDAVGSAFSTGSWGSVSFSTCQAPGGADGLSFLDRPRLPWPRFKPSKSLLDTFTGFWQSQHKRFAESIFFGWKPSSLNTQDRDLQEEQFRSSHLLLELILSPLVPGMSPSSIRASPLITVFTGDTLEYVVPWPLANTANGGRPIRLHLHGPTASRSVPQQRPSFSKTTLQGPPVVSSLLTEKACPKWGVRGVAADCITLALRSPLGSVPSNTPCAQQAGPPQTAGLKLQSTDEEQGTGTLPERGLTPTGPPRGHNPASTHQICEVKPLTLSYPFQKDSKLDNLPQAVAATGKSPGLILALRARGIVPA